VLSAIIIIVVVGFSALVGFSAFSLLTGHLTFENLTPAISKHRGTCSSTWWAWNMGRLNRRWVWELMGVR